MYVVSAGRNVGQAAQAAGCVSAAPLPLAPRATSGWSTATAITSPACPALPCQPGMVSPGSAGFASRQPATGTGRILYSNLTAANCVSMPA